jgi:hypothetical protein
MMFELRIDELESVDSNIDIETGSSVTRHAGQRAPAMTKYTSLPLESHKIKSLFLKHARNVGRAYKNQALELISVCQLLSRIASPKCVHEDAELRR